MSRVEPITREAVGEVAEFLHHQLNPKIPIGRWAGILSWDGLGSKARNAGFLLRQDGQVVGVYGAVYAARTVAGREENFCNLHSWCVLDDHRSESMELVRALLRQPGLNFFNPTPNPLTVPIFEMLRFRFLDSRVCIFFNVPRPARGGIIFDQDQLEGLLGSGERRRIQDHRLFPWIEQVAVGRNGRWCHLIFRKRLWKGLGCAEILHVGDPDVFLKYRGRFQQWLFLHRGLPTMQVEARFFPHPPSRLMAVGQPRMVLSRTVEDRDFLNLYTDRVALAEEC